MSKNHKKIFGEQHNIKELSHKKFLSVHTKGTKIFKIFDFSVFEIFDFFGTKIAHFPALFFQKKFFLTFFGRKKNFFSIFF